jgi:hypothetical protein
MFFQDGSFAMKITKSYLSHMKVGKWENYENEQT